MKKLMLTITVLALALSCALALAEETAHPQLTGSLEDGCYVLRVALDPADTGEWNADRIDPDRFAIRQRPNKGLLAGLWEFPNILLPRDATDDDALQTTLRFAETNGANPRELLRETRYVHIFTHIEWHMHVFFFDCAAMPDVFTWATEQELESVFALPSAFRPCLDQLSAVR